MPDFSITYRLWNLIVFDKTNNPVAFQLIESKETMVKNNQLSKQQIHEMQTNLVLVTDTNKTLDRDLQTASKTIVSLR